jgi:alkaline phosphatase
MGCFVEISPGHQGIARRDLLKGLGLGGAGVVIGSRHAHAAPPETRSAKVRGIVFMVSDGMSTGVLQLAESFSHLTRKRGTEWWRLFNDPAAALGLMDTASANSMVTDSAAASSAWGGGQRVNNGAINISPQGKAIEPIAALLKKSAPDTRIGLVTTATITHATPAGFAASVPKRADENDIAPQYLERVDVILGGGSGYFDGAKRPDKRDLRADFIKAGYGVVSNRDQLLAAREKKLLGTFTSGHLPFSIDRDHDAKLAARVPTLTEMTGAALSRFLEDGKPFLLQVEGARIDHAAHLNDIGALLADQLAFDDALAKVLAMTAGRNDILVVITSDHGNANPGLNGMGMGYSESTQRFQRITRFKASHERIFADWNKLKSGDVPQLTGLVESALGLVLRENEAAALHDILRNHEVEEWNHLLDKPEGLLGQFAGNHTAIGWTGTTHTADNTLVSSIGPQAARFSGIVKNTDVFTHLVEMLG